MKYFALKCIAILSLCFSIIIGMFSGLTAAATENSVEFVTAAEKNTALDDLTAAMMAEIDLLPATGGDRNGRVRLSTFTQSADGSTDMKDLKGPHYLIRFQSDVFYILDGSWTGTDGNLPLKTVTVADPSTFYYISGGATPSMAFTFHYQGKASNGMPTYVLRFNNGKNLGVGSQYTGTYTNLYNVKADSTTDLSKAPQIRFEHPDGSGWARIRNAAGTHGLRQDSNMTCVRWKDNSAGDNAYDGNALYLYRVWSTEALAKQIHEMQSYLETPELYEESVYEEFLACLEDSIALFNTYNPNPTRMIDAYEFVQDKLDGQVTKLKAFISKLVLVADPTLEQSALALRKEVEALPTTGAHRNGRVRLAGFTQSANGSTDMKELKGKHYLIRNQDSVFYAIDGSWTGTDGNVPLKVVNPSDTSSFLYITSGISTTMAFDFHYRGKASNGMPTYVLRFNNGKNLGVGSQYTGTYTNLYNVKADTTTDLSKAPQIRFEHPDGSGWARIRNAAGTHGLRQDSDLSCVRWKDNSAGDNAYDGNALYLYRLWSTKTIITAIHDMKGYLDTPEFYDETVFRQFMTCMEEAIALFQKYNVVPTALIQPYDFIQDTLDAKEAELRAFASKLTVNMKDPSAASLNAKTTIHQLPSKQVRAEGDYSHNMSYIIQTRGGKIIIIDGGWEQDNSDGKFLFSYLQQITGDSTPHIDAWFITHAHGDHHGAVSTFANLYKDQVTIDAYYHHNPTEAELTKYMPTESITGVNRVSMQMKKFRNKEGGEVQQIKVNSRHSGKCNSSFDFDDVHIDILLDFSDIIWAADNVSGTFSGTWPVEGRNFKNLTLKELVKGNFNETSIVFRVSVGGKNVLFTGDAGYVAGYMLNKYHDAHASNNNKYYSLQSDYVQVAHHGYYGVTKATYNRIDPDVGLWPTPKYEYTGTKSELALPYALEWFAEMGVKNYPSYLGPQVFEFPVARSATAISIPSELKPYVFDAEYYVNRYPDLAELYGNDEAGLYYHFVNYGIEEGRSASPFFDVKYYAAQNTHHMTDTFRGNFVKAFNDFLGIYRTDTLRRWSPIFDATLYSKRHTELAAQGYTTNFSLLKHYVNNGYKTGEIGSSTFVCDNGLITTNHYSCTTTKATAPTCTTAGRTFSAKCSSCDMTVAGGEVIPATGHTPVIDPGVKPDCTSTGLTEGKHCSVCNTVIVAQTILSTTGHTYTYTKVDTQTHAVGCENCDLSETESHSYVDGTCICGEAEVKEPIVDEAIVINHTLNLASDISINFAIKSSLLTDYVNHYMVIEIPVYKNNDQTGTRTVTVEPVLNGNYYYYTLTGLTAVNMGDVVSAQLHMEKDGQEYLSKVDTYSVAQYAYSQLSKAGNADSLKTLCVDLLRYGKEAQIYKSYRTDSPVDSAMTEEYMAYLSDVEAVTFGNTNTVLSDLANPKITWAGKALNLDSKVCLKFIFLLGSYTGEASDLSLKVSYTDTKGAKKELVLNNAELYNERLSYYAFTLDALLAAELRSVVDLQIYEGETPISCTLQYSADTYGNNKTGQLLTLCKALFAYSDSARAYFAN